MTSTYAPEPVADQYAAGTNAEGEQWSLARYGTQVVLTIDGYTDDIQCPTEQEAVVEYEGMLAELSDSGQVDRPEPVADQSARGLTVERVEWELARYGTRVVRELGDHTKQVRCTSEPEAVSQYAGMLAELSSHGLVEQTVVTAPAPAVVVTGHPALDLLLDQGCPDELVATSYGETPLAMARFGNRLVQVDTSGRLVTEWCQDADSAAEVFDDVRERW